MPDTSLLAHLTAAIYWALVVCWSAILVFYVREYRRLRQLNPLIATLIVVIFIDGARTLAESGYFGTWYTAKTGLIPYSIFTLLTEPRFVILPKILNLVAALIIIAFVVRRWFGDVAQETQRHLDLERYHTELLEAHTDLRRSEERYRLLVQTMNEGLSVLDEQDRLTYVNEALCQMLGYSPDEMKGHTPSEFLDEANRETLRGQLARRRKGEDQPYELSWTTKDQRRVHTIVSPRPVVDPAGGYEGSFAVLTDITRRKQMEDELSRTSAELQRSNTELEQFAYVASHDLQEPLRKIIAFGDRLDAKHSEGLGEQGRDCVERMRDAARRMRGLIGDLLAYSRVTTKAQPFEPVDLSAIAQGVLSDLEVRIQQTGGRVEVGALPTIDADPAQMRQLLQNLIGNALKFHREGVAPVVKVFSRPVEGPEAPDDPRHRITVEDNGLGFDPKHLDRIFGVFQRLHGRSEFEGTGIGLAICRRVAERHGGTITADSTPGQGARFIVTLPTRHGVEEQAV